MPAAVEIDTSNDETCVLSGGDKFRYSVLLRHGSRSRVVIDLQHSDRPEFAPDRHQALEYLPEQILVIILGWHHKERAIERRLRRAAAAAAAAEQDIDRSKMLRKLFAVRDGLRS